MNHTHCFDKAVILIVHLISQKLLSFNKWEINICIKMFGMLRKNCYCHKTMIFFFPIQSETFLVFFQELENYLKRNMTVL